ncbi:Uncharacterised protein [Mycobacteroides abscessus subsp. abscessus]|nr:Uncharacterised protein [Mycobacteroides abscessus subsp. abscessus]
MMCAWQRFVVAAPRAPQNSHRFRPVSRAVPRSVSGNAWPGNPRTKSTPNSWRKPPNSSSRYSASSRAQP